MGRPKGSRNRVTQANIELANSFDVTPLEHMLAVLNDPDAKDERKDEMAKAAAPYVHPKLLAAKFEVGAGGSNSETDTPGLSRVHEILGNLVGTIIEGELADPREDGSLLSAQVPASEA